MADETVETVRQRWLDSGWQQGSLISAADLAGALVTWWPSTPVPVSNSTDFAVVITQTCDLLSEKEPAVELILVREAQTPRNSYRNARHPRILQFDVTGAPFSVGEAVITYRGWMPRDELLKLKIAGEVVPSDSPSLQSWLGNRYSRKAMPDAFWERLRSNNKQKKELNKVLEACGPDVIDIFIALDPRDAELSAGVPYEVAVKVAVPRTVKSDAVKHRRVAEEVLEPLMRLFSGADGFVLLAEHCEVIGSHELSLELLQELETLDASYSPLDNDAG